MYQVTTSLVTTVMWSALSGYLQNQTWTDSLYHMVFHHNTNKDAVIVYK